MTLNELIDRFLRDRQRSGCRPTTLRVYTSRLRSLAATFGPRKLTTLTRPELLDWIDHESHWPDTHKDPDKRGQRKRPDTIRMILTVLAMLQTFALDREALTDALLKPKDLRKPKSRRRERLATETETQQLLHAANPHFRRMYEALRRTGARPSELCNADIAHIVTDDERRTIILTHHKTSDKDGSLRKIPISSGVAAYFDTAIGERTTGPIFLNPRGQRWKRDQLTTTFRRLRRKLHLDEAIKLYCTRHEFGSEMTRKHGLFEAKTALGHADVGTTQRYAHMRDDELHQCQADLFTGEADQPAA